MQDQPLIVYSLQREAPPLRVLRDALKAQGYPVSLSTSLAGEATEAELEATDWEGAFVRWTEPELHDVAFVERGLCPDEEEVDALRIETIHHVETLEDQAGQLIVTDHLRRTKAIYASQLLPALLSDDDHAAWDALDVALTTLAQNAQGLIYAQGEGYCEADGELLLAETDDFEEEWDEEEDEEDNR